MSSYPFVEVCVTFPTFPLLLDFCLSDTVIKDIEVLLGVQHSLQIKYRLKNLK